MSDKRPWLKWYGLARWKHLRQAQLTAQPLCERCLDSDIVTEATVVHHRRAHKGCEALFFDTANLESICKPHHDRDGQLEDHGKTVIRYDASGWPI